ncbi:CD276 antigen homolog [Heterodontus francisci]|uniref:CD276 antigen homolog n=1 Tax=Heterodontus francisci TaxID=7792 RepID=UPI00355BD5F0
MKTLFLRLLMSVLSAVTVSELKVTGTHRGEIILPCSSKDRSITRAYWQKQTSSEPHVLKAFCKTPHNDCERISPAYINRSTFTGNLQQGNYSLKLRDLTLADEGHYYCVLQGETQWIDTGCNIEVKVVALYSEPKIIISREDLRLHEEVNLTCSSSSGDPKAKVRWINQTDKSDFAEEQVMTTLGSGEHGIYNITSVLRTKVSQDFIICQIFNDITEANKTSKPFNLFQRATPGLRTSSADNEKTAPIVCYILIVGLSLFYK